MENVEKIVKTTQKNALLGFLYASLVAVAVLCGVIGKQWLNSEEVSKERLKALQECALENKQLQVEKQTILQDRINKLEAKERQADSLVIETQKVLNNVKK